MIHQLFRKDSNFDQVSSLHADFKVVQRDHCFVSFDLGINVKDRPNINFGRLWSGHLTKL